ncbi:MAG: 7-cyano-7-deazaguanine synthase QueC, partial [bacterium]|nr:7-cyano-7-deazaguanine synthase QueC [bacterium]
MGNILILSGGLDSTVSAFDRVLSAGIPSSCVPDERSRGEDQPPPGSSSVLALTFDYGQRAAEQEKKAAAFVAAQLGIEHKVIGLPWLKELTQTSLVSTQQVLPQLKISELDDFQKTTESAKNVWVPNRNGVFLNIAATFAESLGCDTIITGFNAEEAVTFPDNSADFVKTANRFFSFSTLNKVQVKSYTQQMTKEEIVRKGVELGVDFSKIWSCYEGGEKQCGRCESCLRSIRAYKAAGIWDKARGAYAD